MKILENTNHCYGCAACYNICPAKAIHMLPNEEGFLEPVIDEAKCISCKKCVSVCPANHTEYPNTSNPDVYGFSADENILFQSSSGGIFTFLAEYVLKTNGYVVGAAYDSEFNVKHIIIHNMEDLDLLRRSKYLQSEIGDTYQQTKDLLETGNTVLYSGCPCQIAGLHRFLNKEYSQLYTVDVLCHGIPSPGKFHEHIENTYGGFDNVQDIEFRSREGWGTLFHVKKKKGINKLLYSHQSPYIQSFLNDINLRASCFSCQYSKLPRQGDITIGDMWTAAGLGLTFDYRKGVSLVLTNNEKGRHLLNSSVQNPRHEYHLQQVYGSNFKGSCSLEQLNSNLFYPSTRYSDFQRRCEFFEACKKMPFEQAVHLVLHKMDVGLILYMSNNYGSIATNYSLYKAIQNMGKKVAVLNNLVPIRSEAEKFARKNMCLSSDFIARDDWQTVNQCFDSFVVGSDMSWNSLEYKPSEYYTLGFAGDAKRKIAYAPSFGNRLTREGIDETTRLICSYFMKRLDAVSVREDYGVDVCREVFDIKAEHVLDPVFLCEEHIWEEVSSQAGWHPEEEYLFAYILNPTPEKRQLIQEISRKFQKKPIIVLDMEANFELNKQKLQMDECIDRPDFVKWVAYFQHASYIITDSFHGACFSILFKKRFIAIKNRTKQRFDSLAELIGYPEVFYDDIRELFNMQDYFPEIDYQVIQQRLNIKSKASFDWLSDALEGKISTKEEPSCELVARFFESLTRTTDQLYKLQRTYSYEENQKDRFSKLLQSEGTWLKAVIKAHNLTLEHSDLQQIYDTKQYFQKIQEEGNYITVLSISDEGSGCWREFLEASRLPLRSDLSWRNSYTAILDGRSLRVEQKSNEEIDICDEVVVGVFDQKTDFINGKITVSIDTPKTCKIRVKSKGFTSQFGACRSEIIINNIDYSMNRTGLNIAVIHKKTGQVVDSCHINTYGDVNLTIHRV